MPLQALESSLLCGLFTDSGFRFGIALAMAKEAASAKIEVFMIGLDWEM